MRIVARPITAWRPDGGGFARDVEPPTPETREAL